MTTSRTHSAEEESAIRYMRRKWNKTAKTPLTAGQYADMRVKELFESITAEAKLEQETKELPEAFRSASPQVQASILNQLGITAP